MITAEALNALLEIGSGDTVSPAMPEGSILCPSSFIVTDIEKLLPEPVRYRTTINTHSVDDFVAVTGERGGKVPCFINDETMSAKSIFNLGTKTTPGHGDDQAILTLRKTTEFIELLRINGGRMDQKTTAEWLEDWRDYLTPVWDADVGERATMANAIKVVRQIDIKAAREGTSKVSDFGAEKSELERIEASGRDLPCPARFIFRCAPYHHLQERDVCLRLSLITSSDPQFVLRIVRLESLQEEMMEEFKESLATKLGDNVNVVIGTINK